MVLCTTLSWTSSGLLRRARELNIMGLRWHYYHRGGVFTDHPPFQIQVSSCVDLGSALLIQEMGASSQQKIEMVNKNLQTFIPKVGRGLPFLLLKGGDLNGNVPSQQNA